jgi:hypothetical protein
MRKSRVFSSDTNKGEDARMADKKSIENRRKLLKSIVAGSGAIVAGKSLPEKWSRPVVDSVMLPAHAQTSNQVYSSPLADIGMNGQQIGGNSLFARLADGLIPEADAGVILTTAIACATTSGSMLEFEILYEGKGAYRISGMLPLDKQIASVTLVECPGSTVFSIDMQITSMTPTEVVLALVDDGAPTFTIPEAVTCVTVPPLVCG